MSTYYWDERLDYLLRNRLLYWNDDYLEFLVSRVWAITDSVHVVDFGCGYGYLGLKLLPLLPAGSKYTGIDRGDKLLATARRLFEELPHEAEFIRADINTVELAENDYDVAICQALLVHLPNAQEVLAKMIRAVRPQGMVIAIEPHRNGFAVNQYIPEFETLDTVNLDLLFKLRELDRARTGCDGNIGIKLPVYMQELGLRNVGCRVTDRVNFYHPDLPDAEKERLYSVLHEEAFGSPIDRDVAALIPNLTARGLSGEEARELAAGICATSHSADTRGNLCHILQAANMMITYGTK